MVDRQAPRKPTQRAFQSAMIGAVAPAVDGNPGSVHRAIVPNSWHLEQVNALLVTCLVKVVNALMTDAEDPRFETPIRMSTTLRSFMSSPSQHMLPLLEATHEPGKTSWLL